MNTLTTTWTDHHNDFRRLGKDMCCSVSSPHPYNDNDAYLSVSRVRFVAFSLAMVPYLHPEKLFNKYTLNK